LATASTASPSAGGNFRIRTRIDDGSTLDQKLHHIGMGFRRGPHQSGMALGLLFGVYICTAVQQQPYRLQAAGAGSHHDRSFAKIRERSIDVCSGLQQFVDDCRVTVRGRQAKRCDSEAIRRLPRLRRR
jgi:hypothetical protein